MTGISRVADAFRELTGRGPDGVWSAPGRVNLIGEHTDYNDGLVLPLAIDRVAMVAVGVRQDGMVRCASLQFPGQAVMDLADIAANRIAGWEAYPLGVLWAMERAGHAVPGLDIVIESAIRSGAGLGSSAAVEVALALAVAELSGETLATEEVARCCQAGEDAVAGAPTGIMDQLAVLEGRAGHAVLLDCASLERELLPLDLTRSEATLLVIDTSVVHATSGEGYRARRDECRRAAAELGVRSLRDASPADVAGRLTGVLRRRARHVVSENGRVARTAGLLRRGALRSVGELLDQSHASLRDDFEASCPELDLATATAVSAGAWGARLTGAGFGGCAIALLASADSDGVTEAVVAAFADRGFHAPHIFPVSAADGARRCL